MTSRAASARSHVVEHDGCALHVDIVGDGPRVLTIQGVGVHGDGWLPQVNALANRFTLARFDNRGMGRSVPADLNQISLDQMASDAIAVMDGLGWSDAHLVGHSLGGLVAMAVALMAKSRVRSLALLCTFANGKDCAPPTLPMIWWGARSRIGTRRMRRNGFLHILYPPGRTPDVDAESTRLAPLFGHDLADSPAVVGPQLKVIRSSNVAPRLSELAGIPTLVVSATHDLIAPPAAGRAVAAAIPNARFVEVPGAAHGLPITHAQVTNDLLAAHWLK